MSRTKRSGEYFAAPEPRPAGSAELVDIDGVAALLGCSGRHVRRMSDEGWMPKPVKLGALTRWRRAEIIRWVESGCCPLKGGGHE